ncbi:MAG TPA: STAS/SEC14 domain-containing protein [Hanamia sp.]
MIEVIPGFPPNVAAFNATGKITGQDYDEIINPLVEKIYKESGKINYLLVINTPLENYNFEAWFKDALLGFVYFTEWRKIAIVSNNRRIKNFTNVFGKFIPGGSKGFLMEELDAAKEWIVD